MALIPVSRYDKLRPNPALHEVPKWMLNYSSSLNWFIVLLVSLIFLNNCLLSSLCPLSIRLLGVYQKYRPVPILAQWKPPSVRSSGRHHLDSAPSRGVEPDTVWTLMKGTMRLGKSRGTNIRPTTLIPFAFVFAISCFVLLLVSLRSNYPTALSPTFHPILQDLNI